MSIQKKKGCGLMTSKNPMLNASGCKDMTAYEAINNVSKEEHELNQKVHDVIKIIKRLIDLTDLELIGRIQIKDKKTGREFR